MSVEINLSLKKKKSANLSSQAHQTKRLTYISNRFIYIKVCPWKAELHKELKALPIIACSPIRLTGPGLRFLQNIFIPTHTHSYYSVAHGKLWFIWECKMNMWILNRAGIAQSCCLPQKALRSTPFKRSVSNVHFKKTVLLNIKL